MVFSHWKLDEIDIFPASIASPHEAMWTSIGGCLTFTQQGKPEKAHDFPKVGQKTGKQNYSNVNFRRSTSPWEWMNQSIINNNNSNDKYKIYNNTNITILVFFAKTTKNDILSSFWGSCPGPGRR
jgi:hypothetical protein